MRPRHVQLGLGARHGDVEQAAFLAVFVGRGAAVEGKDAVLDGGQEDDGPLEALGGVACRDGDAGRVGGGIGGEGAGLEERAEVGGGGGEVDEFLYMVPAGVGVACLAEMLFVACEVQDAVQEVGDGGVAEGVQLVRDVDERADGAEEGGAQGVRVCEVREERHLLVLCGGGEHLHAVGADAALGHGEDAQDGGGVGGVVGEGEVGEEVADLGAVEEADAAEEAVGDVEAVEDAFEWAAVGGGAEQDAHVRVGRGAGVLADVAGDKEGFVVGVVAGADDDGRAAGERGVEALGDAEWVLLHDAEGGVEDLGRAAEVFFEEDAVQAGEVEVHALDVAHVGVAPAVDALVGVADDADVGRQAAQELVLHGVRVLELVDEDVVDVRGELGVLAEEAHAEEEQVVKVERMARAELLLVRGVCAAQREVLGVRWRAGRVRAGRAQLVGRPAVGLGARDGRERGVGVALDVSEEAPRVVRVGDREARIEAEASAPAAQEAHAHGVEGAEHESARAVRADHRLEARAHLVRGAVRERDDDAPLRRDRRRAVANEPRHARREHARLAGPGAREDLQGPRGVGRHRRVLGGGQHVERGTGRPGWVAVEP